MPGRRGWVQRPIRLISCQHWPNPGLAPGGWWFWRMELHLSPLLISPQMDLFPESQKMRNCFYEHFLKIFFFLLWTIFKSLLNLLHYCFCSLCLGFFGHEVRRILAPQPRITSLHPSFEGEFLITELLWKSLEQF